MELVIRELDNADPSLEQVVYPLLLALRPQLSREAFRALIHDGGAQGARVLVACGADGQCVAAAIYRVLATSRGRVLFLDDLVTKPEARSHGVGAALLTRLEKAGREAGCERLELDSGVNNLGAHRFYHRHQLGIVALHFGKQLAPQPDQGAGGSGEAQ